jgi:hypothetical protein
MTRERRATSGRDEKLEEEVRNRRSRRRIRRRRLRDDLGGFDVCLLLGALLLQ